jgi:membrane-associated phospholipid phosphatase
MDPLTSFGIAFARAFQSMGGWLQAPMALFSFLGSENFYLLFLPLVYWSIDAALGIRVGFMLVLGTAFNLLFKMGFHAPRPYWVSPEIRGLASEPSFGVPSFHAQLAATVWGMVAAFYRKAWIWVAAVVLVFLIGISRLHLGVHFPQDILVGWALGFLTLWAVVRFWEPVAARVKQMSFWNRIGLAFAISLVMILLGVLIVFLLRDFVVPAEWVANATRDGNAAPDGFAVQLFITPPALLFGMCTGLAWMATRGGFRAAGPLWQRIVRYVVGLLGVMVLYAGLKAVFPSGDALVPYIFRYVRYALVGFWIFGGAPWLFRSLRLSESK